MDIYKDTLMTFVYGTLKVGGALSSNFDPFRIDAVKAKIYGYDMYSNGMYPMIVKSNDDGKIVFGEYHYYSDAKTVLHVLDRCEGYIQKREEESMFLRRKEIVYSMDDEEIGPCFLYIWNRPIISTFEKLDGVFDID